MHEVFLYAMYELRAFVCGRALVWLRVMFQKIYPLDSQAQPPFEVVLEDDSAAVDSIRAIIKWREEQEPSITLYDWSDCEHMLLG